MTILSGDTTTMYVMGAVIFLLFALCTYLITVINKGKRFKYLSALMEDCALKNRPLGLICDKNGTLIPFGIERNEKNRGLLKNGELTLIHPELDKSPSTTRMRIRNGPETVIYQMPFFFPFDVGSSASLVQIVDNLRKDKNFNWMPSELSNIELLFNGSDTFERDARNTILSVVVNGVPIPDSWYDVLDRIREAEAIEADYDEVEDDEEDELEEDEPEEEE